MALPRSNVVGRVARLLTGKRTALAVGLAVFALAGAACSAAPPAPATPSMPTSAMEPSSSADQITTIKLADMPAGTVTLNWDRSTQRITATTAIYGLTPGSRHAMHIHPGTCADQSQPPSVPFGDVSADSFGAANEKVTSTRAVAQGIPGNSYVNIHLAPSAQLGSPGQVSFTPIACADIPAGTPAAGPVTLQLQRPGQHPAPSGSATMRYNSAAHTLNVAVTAAGLVPNSAHATHIHAGSCRKQGDVVYPLPDLKADSTGRATLTSTITGVNSLPPTSGWYLNIHFGPMSQILDSAEQPTMAFAPILCGDIRN